jgi:hypothetical protein
VAGFVDWLDPAGQVLADAGGADYVRRWRVLQIAAEDPEAIAIDVCVFDIRSSARRLSDADACLATARVRQP